MTPNAATTAPAVEVLVEQARRLAAVGREAEAKAAYLAALRLDPTHAAALIDLARLALRSGHGSAARTALGQAIACHPECAIARVGLGNLLLESGELEAARDQFQAAASASPALAQAHQGLARALTGLGEAEAAEPHWRLGFAGHALAEQRFHGAGRGVPLLLVVSAMGGNVPTRTLVDDTVFAVTALFAEFHDPAEPLPPHALVFNAIGDADLCGEGLEAARRIVARSSAPVVNHPDAVRLTGRADNAARLAGLPGVVTPQIACVSRAALLGDQALAFPLLVRSPGFNTGQHFVRVERREDLAGAIAALPGETLLAIDYLDARGADGLARKCRVMFIDGEPYPLHLAASPDWKVHYFTSDAACSAARRAEEAAFLDDMPAVLGPRAMAALGSIRDALGLDYAGVDFALDRDGRLLLFEANAGMVIQPPGPEAIWDYRRAPIDRALAAARAMLLRRAAPTPADPRATLRA